MAADDLVLVGVRSGEDLVGGDAWADRRVEAHERWALLELLDEVEHGDDRPVTWERHVRVLEERHEVRHAAAGRVELGVNQRFEPLGMVLETGARALRVTELVVAEEP